MQELLNDVTFRDFDEFEKPCIQRTYSILGRMFYGVSPDVLDSKIARLAGTVELLDKEITVDFNDLSQVPEMTVATKKQAMRNLKYALAELYVRSKGYLYKLREFKAQNQTIRELIRS